MRDLNLFKEDIIIPEEVDKKMNAAFALIRSERRHSMKNKSFKKIMSVAACAAVVLSASLAVGLINKNNTESIKDTADLNNSFKMTVNAMELSSDKAAPVINGTDKNGWCISGSDDDSEVQYVISSDFGVEGSDIEYVTYTINNGVFQVIEAADRESLVISGEEEDAINVGEIGGFFDEESGSEGPKRPQSEKYYHSLTFKYQDQPDDSFWLNICGVTLVDESTFNRLFNYDNGNHSTDEESEAINKMLGDTTITCSVKYKDGTVINKDIKVVALPSGAAASEDGENTSSDYDGVGIFYTMSE